ncbi:DUF3515 domain-containing protein [Nocardioides mangrovi]|uniref:DUF3515 domain-containing protein n=1 Tax=Nocardioides mangrovi TaxID=2874580 RepID=A0ABS7U7W7_9ACTN|nr:DUF3515 domain-containing protein [Nocardioides mangrovi]MBZ5737074.1 DUF3515 domain-containing protein [Nocardioides mangrovi]
MCAVLLGASGCDSGPPEIDRPDLPAAQDTACRDIVTGLPATLDGEKSTEVTGATAYGAAWGDPAIVLTCGVGAVDLTDVPKCTTVNGLDWIVQESDDHTTFTTDGRRPRVQVVVPDDYDEPAGLLTGLTDVVRDHSRVEDRCLA